MRHDPGNGAWIEGDARYLLVRHDSLMGLFRRLEQPARLDALKAFEDSVAECGGRSATRYAADDGEKLLATIAVKAGELGWGAWTFAQRAGELELTVRNSPFAQAFGEARHPVCAPIAGMLRSVAGIVLGAPAKATELRCAAQGAAHCVFVARAG